MANKELLDYVKQQLEQHANRQEIQDILITNGWLSAEIEEAFNLCSPQNPAITPNHAVPEVPVAPAVDEAAAQSPKKGSKILWALLGIILGALVVGAGVLGYFYYFPEPGTVVQKMFANFSQVKSAQYSGEIKANLIDQSAENKAQNFSITFAGDSEMQNPDTAKGIFSLAAAGSDPSIGQISLAIEVRSVDKALYIKLTEVPDLGLIDLSFLKDQWVKIDLKSLESLGVQQLKEVEGKQNLSVQQVERLRAVLSQAKILQITQKLAGQKFEGIDTYHYKFTVDKKELKNLIIEINGIVNPDKPFDTQQIADLDKQLAQNNLPEGEIWIGKKDFLPYKISSSFAIEATETLKTSGNVDFILQFKNFNQPVSVEAPLPVKTIEEILGAIFGGLGSSMTSALIPAETVK
jgi:flagellar basal body-associated protein FliL